MSPRVMVWLSVLLSAAAQLFLKHGLDRLTRRHARIGTHPATLLLYAAREVWVWLWALSFVAATALWLLALAKFDLSYAFPLLSIGYVLVSLFSVLLFHERVDRMRWMAVALISLGVLLIAGS